MFKMIIIVAKTKLFKTSKAVIRENFGPGTIMVRLTIMTKTMTTMDNMDREKYIVSSD